MQDKLNKEGIPSTIVGRDLFDHCFLIVNLDKKAKISSPKTWGKNAFIVDPWLNKVFKSKEEAFTEYKRMFSNGFNFLRMSKIKNPDFDLGEYCLL